MKTKVKKNKTKEKIKLSGIIIATAILFIVAGVALIFLVPEYITLKQICYVLALAILATGIVLIVRYFLKESYKNLQEYGFSIGVAFVIIGVIALVRATDLSEYFIFTLGVLMLSASIFKLQTAMDLNALHDRSFIIWLCIAAAFAGCAIAIIMNPFNSAETLMNFAQYVLVADGVISLAGSIYLYFRIRSAEKQAEALINNTEQAAENKTEEATMAEFEGAQ